VWTRIERGLGDQGTLALFLLPGLALLIAAQFYPLAWSAWVSFVNWSLASSPLPRGYADLANYAHALTDPVMRGAAGTTVVFALGTTTLQMSVGFLLAWLTVGEIRLLRLCRTLLILPMVIAPVAVGTMWRMMLSARVGIVNRLLALLGLHGPD
jgi:ABC-type sugar transport system permease subunit